MPVHAKRYAHLKNCISVPGLGPWRKQSEKRPKKKINNRPANVFMESGRDVTSKTMSSHMRNSKVYWRTIERQPATKMFLLRQRRTGMPSQRAAKEGSLIPLFPNSLSACLPHRLGKTIWHIPRYEKERCCTARLAQYSTLNLCSIHYNVRKAVTISGNFSP